MTTQLTSRQVREVLDNILNWETISTDKQKEIVRVLKYEELAPASMYFEYTFDELKTKKILSREEELLVLDNFLNNAKNDPRQRLFLYFYDMLGYDEMIKHLKGTRYDTNYKYVYLFFDKLTLQEEVDALRSITTRHKIWQRVFDTNYKISKEALSKLPPIMRVRVMDHFTDREFMPYNIFEKIDEDDFKSLMFAGGLKYKELATKIWGRYQELSSRVDKTITWNISCVNCGEITVEVKNKMIVNDRILAKTYIGSVMRISSCVICGRGKAKIEKIIK